MTASTYCALTYLLALFFSLSNITIINNVLISIYLLGTFFLAGIFTSVGICSVYLKRDFLAVRFSSGRLGRFSSITLQPWTWLNMKFLISVRKTPASHSIHALLATALAAPSSLSKNAFYRYFRLRARLLRPRLRAGFRRLEWCCVSCLLFTFLQFISNISPSASRLRGFLDHRDFEFSCVDILLTCNSKSCGEYLYGDFKDSDPHCLDELLATLNEQEASAEVNSNNSQSSEILQPRPPQPAHSLPLNANNPSSHHQPLKNQSSSTTVAINHNSASLTPVYFEICINSGRWQRRLGEINVSEAHNDGLFFGAIKEKYTNMRRRRKFSFVEPRDIRYVRVRSLSFFISVASRHKPNLLVFHRKSK